MNKKREYSQAQNKATQKYIKENYDEIKLRVPKGLKEKMQSVASAQKKSLNQYIVDCVLGIPKGYTFIDDKLVVVEPEAEKIKGIYEEFLSKSEAHPELIISEETFQKAQKAMKGQP